jgi:hypothetical protein
VKEDHKTEIKQKRDSKNLGGAGMWAQNSEKEEK